MAFGQYSKYTNLADARSVTSPSSVSFISAAITSYQLAGLFSCFMKTTPKTPKDSCTHSYNAVM